MPADPALARLSQLPAEESVVLLHSGRHHPRWATKSMLARPRAVYRYGHDHRSELLGEAAHGPGLPGASWTHNLWTDLRMLLEWPGRWIGYISYDIARLIEPGKLSASRPGIEAWPLIELAWCPQWEELPAASGISNLKSEVSNLKSQISPLISNFTRPAYEAAVRRVLDYIAAGDIFQANIAQRFSGTWPGNPRKLYERLATISPAWYGAYLEMPHGNLLSTSPELFLEVNQRHVVTRPIKGTRQGSLSSPAQNAESRDELLRSPKDLAELNMIVDLMRNDLGKICAYGSVHVDVPREIESHPTIHHGVATITGTLHESKDIVDLLRATLPGGSVTGAPKVRAMQIIDELEPNPRGPYCGCIGWLTKDACQLNIAIRTILLTRTTGGDEWNATFSVGGGIVADSNPAAEYEETLTKAAAMMRALAL